MGVFTCLMHRFLSCVAAHVERFSLASITCVGWILTSHSNTGILFADLDMSQKTHVPLIGLRLHNGRMEIWEVNGSQQSDHQGTYLGCSLIPCYLTLPARKSFHTFGKMRRFTRREVLRLQMGDMYIEVSQVVSANTLSRTFRQPLPFDT